MPTKKPTAKPTTTKYAKIDGDGFARPCACFDCDNVQTTGKPNVCCAECAEALHNPKIRDSHC